jgi:hypothetical protein
MQITPDSLIFSDKVQVYSPLVSQARWAEMTGLSVGSVEAAVARHLWPFVKIGRHKFINVEAVRLLAVKKAAEEFTR